MLEKLKSSIEKGVAAVSVKSESLVESSRVRTAISNTQRNMDEAIRQLGVSFYNSWVSADLDVDKLKAECERIKAMADEIENHKARLEKIKEEENQILGNQKKATPEPGKSNFCTGCGKRLDPGARFCNECGTQVQ